ncbi:MAG: hypothetical protein J1F42_01170 [Lachnospiraceae bacterium]|nr:hypothetical protein [Lachnospiraceae bacterium]
MRDKILNKYGNCILTLAVMALNVLLMGIFFDFYYDLNDDTMMLDIMAGVYTGVPDGHNMQTLYLLGALIATCYKIWGTVPWYGLFLCLCQFGCLYLIGVRLCDLWDGVLRRDGRRTFGAKILLMLMLSLFQWGICLSHLVNVQYTITCAMLSATAIFLFVTTDEGLGIQQFIEKNSMAISLVITAYMLRSEMLLLTFPFICLGGLYRLTWKKKIWTKENLCKYGAVLGMMLGGMLMAGVVDYAAYGSPEWRDFRQFFDARTTVYDFYPQLITDESYSEDLTQLGVMPYQQTLLNNYNFGLDDEIDTELLTKVADYATGTLRSSKDWGATMRDKLYAYIYRLTHGQDAPYHVMVFWAYAAVFVAGYLAYLRNDVTENGQASDKRDKRRFAFIWQLILLGFVRTAIWMFILMREREPERITHSLYLVEFALLAAMLSRELCDICRRGKRGGAIPYMKYGLGALFVLITVGGMVGSVTNTRSNQDARAQMNAGWYAIDTYCREHKECFYLEDVYSTVYFSRRMFADVDNSYANYDIMGGWMCKSPLYREKLQQYDIDSAGDALLNRDDVYLIISQEEVLCGRESEFMDFYRAQGVEAELECIDLIDDNYLVYRITGQ